MSNTSEQIDQRHLDRRFPLAPMTVADILDTTVDLVKHNWRALILLSLFAAFPMALGTFLVNWAFDAQAGAITGSIWDGVIAVFSEGGAAAAIAITTVSLIIGVVVIPLVYGAITRVVAGAYLGREFSSMRALGSMLPMWLTLIASNFLVSVAVFVGLFAAGVGAFFAQVLFLVVVPVVAVEQVGPIKALKRSWKLMTGKFVQYIAVIAAVLLVEAILSQLAAGLTDVLSLVFLDNVPLSSALAGVSIVLSTLITTPFLACAATLIYFDARVRTEGFDIQMMSAGLIRGGVR